MNKVPVSTLATIRKAFFSYQCQSIYPFLFLLFKVGILPFLGIPDAITEGQYLIAGLYIIGILFSITLFFKSYWPSYLIATYPLYPYMVIVYCFSILPMVNLAIFPSTSYIFVISIYNLVLDTLFLATLLNPISFGVLTVISNLIALIIIKGLLKSPSITDLYPYFFTWLAALLFFTNKNRKNRHTRKVLASLSKELTHDLTNVLGISQSYASMLHICMQATKVYKKKNTSKVSLEMPLEVYSTFDQCFKLLKEAHQQGQQIMKLRISSLGCKIKKERFAIYKASDSIKEALLSYRNMNQFYYKLPTLKLLNDFTFYGSNKHLKQAIISLIAHSYKYQEDNVARHITCDKNEIQYHYIGKGIGNEKLINLFDYPQNLNKHKINRHAGGGLGSFYYVRKVMEAFGGKVICHSNTNLKHPHTLFILQFPKNKT